MIYPLLNTIYTILSGLMGLLIGSFLNVVIYRLPLNMNIAMPPSHCPICNNRLKWYHNIPVISWLFLKGKCAFCGALIPVRYTLVELLNALLWLFCYLLYGYNAFTIVAMLFSSVLICIFFIDLEHTIIPDSLNICILLLGIIVCIFCGNALGVVYWERIISCVGMLILGLGIFNLFKLITKRDALGGGDIKFLAAIGLLLGWKLSLLTLFLSALLGCAVTLLNGLFHKQQINSPIPFGPFLSICAIFSMFFGNVMIQAYLNLF